MLAKTVYVSFCLVLLLLSQDDPTKCNSDPITVKTEILQSCFVFVLPDVGSVVLIRFAVGVATDARQLIAVAFLVASSAYF